MAFVRSATVVVESTDDHEFTRLPTVPEGGSASEGWVDSVLCPSGATR